MVYGKKSLINSNIKNKRKSKLKGGKPHNVNYSDFKYLRTIGMRGSDPGQFIEPTFLALDHAGNLVVTDESNHRLQVIRLSDGVCLRTIGSQGSGAGQFNKPRGVAFDNAGNIIVADWGNHRVQMLRYSDGSHVRTIGTEGRRDGQLLFPLSVAVDKNGNIFVYDSLVFGRIQVFSSSSGAYIRKITLPVQGPTGSSSSSGFIRFDPWGNIVVIMLNDNTIYILNTDGNVLHKIRNKSHGEFNLPQSVAFDNLGNIIVADTYNHRIQVLSYEQQNKHLLTFGSDDKGPRNLRFPTGVLVDSQGRIIVSDTFNNCIKIFEPVSAPEPALAPGPAPVSEPAPAPVPQPVLDVPGPVPEPVIDVPGAVSSNSSDLAFSKYSQFIYLHTILDNFRNSSLGFKPFKMDFDNKGKIIVVDQRHDIIIVLDPIRAYIERIIGGHGTGPGQFSDISDVLFHDDYLIVSEIGNKRVQLLRYSDGSHLGSIAGENMLLKPNSVAVYEEELYVFDTDMYERIQVFRLSDGAYLRSMCPEGNEPGNLGRKGSIVFDEEGNMVVADTLNNRIQVLRRTDGAHLRTIVGFSYPTGVAFDREGNIVVIDAGLWHVKILRYSDGSQVKTIDRDEEGNRYFSDPTDVLVDGIGRIIVLNNNTQNIKIFGTAEMAATVADIHAANMADIRADFYAPAAAALAPPAARAAVSALDWGAASKPFNILIPDAYICPLSQQIMRDPVLTSDGHTYEREKIEEYLLDGNMTRPGTDEILTDDRLISNLALRKLIEEFCSKHQYLCSSYSKDFWECSTCTLRNPMKNDRCEACQKVNLDRVLKRP